jgi:signal transduction histidine kinase
MRCKSHIFIIGLFFYSFLHQSDGYAQSPKDSLQKVISFFKLKKGFEQDTNYIKTIHKLTDLYFDLNADSMLYFANQTFLLSQKINYLKGQTISMRQQGGAYYAKNNYTEALLHFQKALNLAEKLNDKLQIGLTLSNLSEIFTLQNKHKKALEYDYKALEIFKELYDQERITFTLVHIANYFTAQKDYLKAIDYHQKALLVAEKSKNEYLIAFVNLSFAKIYLEQRKYDIAINTLKPSLVYYIKTANILGEADVCILLARIYVDIQKYESALDFALRAFQLSQTIKDKLRVKQASEVLVHIYEAQSDFPQALFYHKILKIYSDSLFNNESYKKITELNAKYEYEKKEQKLINLQKRNELEKNLQISRQRFYLLLITGVLFLMLLIVGFVLHNRHKIQRLYDKLQKAYIELDYKNDEIAAQNEELQVQQEEIISQRNTLIEQNEQLVKNQDTISIQNELIKSQNQTLEEEVKLRTTELEEYANQLEKFAFITAHNLSGPVARVLGLGKVLELQHIKLQEKEAIIEKLIFSTQEIDKVIKDLIKILEIKRPDLEQMTEINLENLLLTVKEELSKEISESGISINSDFNGLSFIYSYQPYIMSLFYHLISNAVKYRHPEKAPCLDIKIELNDDFYVLSFKDNGLGIDLKKYEEKIFSLYQRFHPQIEGKGFGLFLIKSKIVALGGKIEVKSVVNEGTTFIITLRNIK